MGSLGAGQVADAIGPGRALVWNNLTLLVGSLLCAVSPGGMWAAVLGAAPSSSTEQGVCKDLRLHEQGRRRRLAGVEWRSPDTEICMTQGVSWLAWARVQHRYMCRATSQRSRLSACEAALQPSIRHANSTLLFYCRNLSHIWLHVSRLSCAGVHLPGDLGGISDWVALHQ